MHCVELDGFKGEEKGFDERLMRCMLGGVVVLIFARILDFR
jgi:hypothetical protein